MNKWRELWVNRQCEKCEEELFEEELLCALCLKEMNHLLYPIATDVCGFPLFSLYHYKGMVRDLLRKMKFKEARHLSHFFAQEIIAFLRENKITPEVVSYVPMHGTKARQRGFDQARDLAEETAKRLAIPFEELIRRARPTRPLYSLTAAERAKELKGAFEPLHTEDERLWMMVDDIVTSGATLYEVAHTLVEARISHVVFLVIAR